MTDFPLWLLAVVAAGVAPFLVRVYADAIARRHRRRTTELLANVASMRARSVPPPASGAVGSDTRFENSGGSASAEPGEAHVVVLRDDAAHLARAARRP